MLCRLVTLGFVPPEIISVFIIFFQAHKQFYNFYAKQKEAIQKFGDMCPSVIEEFLVPTHTH